MKELEERADDVLQKDYNHWIYMSFQDVCPDINCKYELQELQNLIRDQQAEIERLGNKLRTF